MILIIIVKRKCLPSKTKQNFDQNNSIMPIYEDLAQNTQQTYDVIDNVAYGKCPKDTESNTIV